MTKVKALVFFFGLLLSCSLAQAQAQGLLTASDSGACTTTNACVTLPILINMGAVAINLTGTFSATLQFEVSIDGGSTWVAASGVSPSNLTSASSATAAGAWRFAVSGATHIRVRCSAYTSGTVVVAMQPSNQAASLWTPALPSSGVLSFGGDTGISRDSTNGAGFLDFGNGSANDISATLTAQVMRAKKVGGVFDLIMYCTVPGTIPNPANPCFTNALAAMGSAGGVLECGGNESYTLNATVNWQSNAFLVGDGTCTITGDQGNAGQITLPNTSSTISNWGITGIIFNSTHTPTSDNNWTNINAKGTNGGWVVNNTFQGGNVGLTLQQSNRDIWFAMNNCSNMFTGCLQDATNYQTVTAASTDGATATLTCTGQCNAKLNENINVFNCSATTSLNTNISSISGSVISYGATVTAVTGNTVSYANTTGAGTPAATGCQVSIQSQNIHENFNNIIGSTGAGIAGPAHDLGNEDTSNLEILGNQITDGAGWTTANSSPFQVFMNKAAIVQNVVAKGNRARALPSQASNATGIQCWSVDSNGNYNNQVFEGNTCDGYKDGIEATGVGIINSQYKNNAFSNVSIGILVDGPSTSRTIVAATGCSESGTTATCTTTAAHLFQAGELVTVAGVGTAGFNNTWTINSIPSTTSFTFTVPATGLATGGGGTAIVTQVPTNLQSIGNTVGSANGNVGSQRGLEYLNVSGLISKDNKVYLSQAEGEKIGGVSRSVFSDYILNSGEAGSNKIALYCAAQGTQNSLSNTFINPMAGTDEWKLGQTPNTNQPLRVDSGCYNSVVNGYLLVGNILRNGEITDSGGGTQWNSANRMTGFGKWTISQVPTPPAPTVSNGGDAGATTWTYVQACYSGGLLGPWSTGTSASNNATLSTTHYNIITTDKTAGCELIRVCRTAVGTSPSTTGFFGNVTPGEIIYDDGNKPNGDASACSSSTNNTGVFDASAAGTLKVPALAGATAAADGQIAYDTTNTNTHIRTNGADSIAAGEAAAIAANAIPKSNSSTVGLLTASSVTDNATKVSTTEFLKTGNTQLLTADSAGVTATTPGTIIFTWGALPVSTNFALHCAGTYSQATGVVANGIAIQGATNAPTRIDAWGVVYITNPASAGPTQSNGSLANLNTTTATAVVTATPNAIATVYQWSLDGTVQTGASATTLNVLWFTGNASDAVTLKAGTYCTLQP